MCKASASLLQRYLEKAHVAYFGSSSDNYPLSFDAAEAQSKEGAVKIHLCDDEEGRPAIVNAIHTVVAQGKELTQEWLDNQLTRKIFAIFLVRDGVVCVHVLFYVYVCALCTCFVVFVLCVHVCACFCLPLSLSLFLSVSLSLCLSVSLSLCLSVSLSLCGVYTLLP